MMDIKTPLISEKTPSTWVTTVFSVLVAAFVTTSLNTGLMDLWKPSALTVGAQTLKLQGLQRILARKYRIFRSFGYTPQQIASHLLDDVIDDLVMEQELARLGLKVSQEAARTSLKQAFREKGEAFDVKRFKRYLSAQGLTLPQLVQEEQLRLGRQRLRNALCRQIFTPGPLLDLAAEGMYQTRYASYKAFPIRADLAARVHPPVEELKSLYRTQAWLIPEQRTYEMLRISPSRLKKDLRQVGQLVARVEEGLAAGRSLEQMAQECGMTLQRYTTTEKGQTLTARGFTSSYGPSDAEAAFHTLIRRKAFEMGAEQDPDVLQMPGGEAAFVRVVEVLPARTLSYEEALPLLTERWRVQYAALQAKKHGEVFLASLSAMAGAKASLSMTALPPMQFSELMHEDDTKARDQKNPIPQVVKETIFRLAPKQKAMTSDARGVYVVYLKEVKPLSHTDPQFEAQRERIQPFLEETLQQLFWERYVKMLRRRYTITFDRDHVKRLIAMLTHGD